MTVNRTIPMRIGESELINFNFAQRLITGQTVVSATYACESPVTEDAATAAVNAAGTIAQARFTVPATAADGIQYTVKCTATCTAPVETKIEYAIITAQLVPT